MDDFGAVMIILFLVVFGIFFGMTISTFGSSDGINNLKEASNSADIRFVCDTYFSTVAFENAPIKCLQEYKLGIK